MKQKQLAITRVLSETLLIMAVLLTSPTISNALGGNSTDFAVSNYQTSTVTNYQAPCPPGTRARLTTWHDEGSLDRWAYDWYCEAGPEVHSPHSGTVVYFGDQGGDTQGMIMINDSQNSACLIMIHLDVNEWQVELVGEEVSTGQEIGAYTSSKNHVHVAAVPGTCSSYSHSDEQPILFNELGYVPSQRITLTGTDPLSDGPAIWVTVAESSNNPPSSPVLTTPANGEWLNTDTPTLHWLPGADDGVPNPSPDYRIQVDNSSDFASPVVDTGWGHTSTSLTTPDLAEGVYYWRVNQGDGDLTSGWTSAWSFGIDTTPPTAGCALAGSSNGSGWYTSDVTLRCYSNDADSGLESSSYTLDGVLQSAEFTVSTEGVHTVGYTAVDNVGNQTSGGLSASIDRTAPLIDAFSINQGAENSFNVNVLLAQESSDAHSGVHQVRISNNALLWSDWQTNQALLAWVVPPYNRLEHTVYLQVRDVAGNESMLATDSIFLDLYPLMPHSANYRICNDVINVAGSTALASANYTLVSSIGQPVANASNSGFLADVAGCLPTEYLSGGKYDLINSVVASGGGLRSSTDYRLGDTVGETAASQASAFSSSSYTLTNGFWSNIVTKSDEPPAGSENFIYLPFVIKQ